MNQNDEMPTMPLRTADSMKQLGYASLHIAAENEASKLPHAGSYDDSITFWQKLIMAWAENKGWNQNLDERSFGDWCTLLTTEISEAYEDHRDGRGFGEVYYEYQGKPVTQDEMQRIIAGWRHDQSPREEERPIFKPCGIPVEMADLAIRLFHLAEFFGFDLGAMIALKMQYNTTRPFRHGGKKV